MRALRVLRAEYYCTSLEDVRLDELDVGCSLQNLTIWVLQNHVETTSVDQERGLDIEQPAHSIDLSASAPRFLEFGAVAQPFLQLRVLKLGVPAQSLANSYTDLFSHLDLSALPLVEVIHLARFRNVPEMSLEHAVSLCDLLLMEFPSLEVLTGLGTRHLRLLDITISRCGRLETIFGLSLLPALRWLDLDHCDILEFEKQGVQRSPDGGDVVVLELVGEETGIQSCGLVSLVLYLWSCIISYCGPQQRYITSTGRRDGLVSASSVVDDNTGSHCSSPLLPDSLMFLRLHGCNAIADLSCLGQGQRVLQSLAFLIISSCKWLPDITSWSSCNEAGSPFILEGLKAYISTGHC